MLIEHEFNDVTLTFVPKDVGQVCEGDVTFKTISALVSPLDDKMLICLLKKVKTKMQLLLTQESKLL